MNRRNFIKTTGAGVAVAGVTAVSAPNVIASKREKTAFVLVHGSWHGAWCWDKVEAQLNSMGHITVAIDLPGHGLNAQIPDSFLKRPLNPDSFAKESSTMKDIGIDEFADAVIVGADRAKAQGATRIVAVGHSMGGLPITFAAAKSPNKFESLIFVAALAPTPGKPAGAYLELEDQHNNSKLGGVIMADPAKIGALRIDTRSEDPKYFATAKEALAEDLDDRLFQTMMHLLTPDAPVAMYGEEAQFNDKFAALKRTFIRCTKDKTLLPSTCVAIVKDMNQAWKHSKTKLVDIDSSHEVMFAKPIELANLLAKYQ